jgi:DNA-binding protein HU-beta
MAKTDDVVSTTGLVEEIAAKNKLSKAQVKSIVDALIASASKHLKKGTKVRLNGFGTFSKAARAARAGRNPQTGATIKIKASKSVRFKASATLKSSL